jgi:hypothetical protein
VVVVPLPRWDTDWQLKTDRKGWPKLRYDKRTGKWVKVKWRPVWDPLWGNPRSNTHWQRSKAVPVVIAAVMQAATAAGLQPCSFMTVRLVWAPGDNRHADEDNLYRLFKTVCDGLARGPRKDLPGLRLVPDDTSQYMDKLAPRIARDVPAGLWLEVTCRG